MAMLNKAMPEMTVIIAEDEYHSYGIGSMRVRTKE
jgi:hypothetical protein